VLQIITYTNLYPDAERTRHGVFVAERLRHLLGTGGVAADVVVPVPWFPFRSKRFGHYGTLARVPGHEVVGGLTVFRPRYPAIPKVGMTLAPLLMAAATWSLVRRLRRHRPSPVVIDAHFLYPDGVAGAIVGRLLGLPVVMTARGDDVTDFPRYRMPRLWIRWAARSCARVITVSDALRDRLLALGIDPAKVITLRNGVDLGKFQPLDRTQAKRDLQLTGRLAVAVGHLIERKGHELMIKALPLVPDLQLVIVGEGPLRRSLEALAANLGVASRVRFQGNVDQSELCRYYSAADISLLASLREGMPNVVLESLACGTPVVALRVEGVPELLTEAVAGEVVEERTPEALAAAIQRTLAAAHPASAVRQHAAGLGWGPTIQGLVRVLTAAATPE
jgi:teichuronic acid biosynthesis glycosyltransferase TuaC